MSQSEKKLVMAVIVMVICAALVLSAVIYASLTFQDAATSPTPSPTLMPNPTPTPTISPAPTPTPTETIQGDYSDIIAAIDSAVEGDTIYVKKGTYEFPINQTLVINKTLSLMGEDAKNTILNIYPAYNETWILTSPFFNYSDAITIDANGVSLLNLTINIANPGGYISATGDRIQIIGNTITSGPSVGLLMNGSYCKINDNIMGGRIQLKGFYNEVDHNSFSYIHLDGDSNTVSNNTCTHIGLGYYSHQNSHNIIYGNIVKTDTRGYSGISLTDSSNNSLYENHISGFIYGIKLWFSSNNTITANTIADSLAASIDLGSSSNNNIYLNNFVDNMEWVPYVYDSYTDRPIREANPNMTVSTNFWDNGKEGNYWSSYNGTDDSRDGIGDTPYVVVENDADRYPLRQPFATSAPKAATASEATCSTQIESQKVLQSFHVFVYRSMRSEYCLVDNCISQSIGKIHIYTCMFLAC